MTLIVSNFLKFIYHKGNSIYMIYYLLNKLFSIKLRAITITNPKTTMNFKNHFFRN